MAVSTFLTFGEASTASGDVASGSGWNGSRNPRKESEIMRNNPGNKAPKLLAFPAASPEAHHAEDITQLTYTHSSRLGYNTVYIVGLACLACTEEVGR